MPCELEFTKSAVRDLDRLSVDIRRRIMDKLVWYAAQAEPLKLAHRLVDSGLGTFRYRVGDWRVVFGLENNIMVVLVVDRRDKIYK